MQRDEPLIDDPSINLVLCAYLQHLLNSAPARHAALLIGSSLANEMNENFFHAHILLQR